MSAVLRAHRRVLGGDLAAAREVEDGVGAGRARGLRRPVGRAVAGDDDLELVARVVERERVGDLGGDDVALGVGGDDQRDGRERRRRRRRAASAGGRCGAARASASAVAHLRPGQQARRDPEGRPSHERVSMP